MGMNTEKRISRARMTRSLRQICKKVAELKICEADIKAGLGEVHHIFQAQSLWVAGSYARGAVTCGDLDLVLTVKAIKSAIPMPRTVARCVYGRFPDVNLFLGDPGNNTSGISFPEAKLLWSSESPDWEKAIASIVVDPRAGRFERKYDVLPLRINQTSCDFPDFEEILEMLEAKILESEWIPIDSLIVRKELWTEDAREFLERTLTFSGEKTRRLMPFVVEGLVPHNKTDTWDICFPDRNRFKIGGSLVSVGRPEVNVRKLDSLEHSSLAIAPHITRKGPNGIWLISRGPEHPISKEFRGCHGYALWYSGGHYLMSHEIGISDITSVNIFSHEADAINYIKEMFDENEASDLSIVRIDAQDILSLIASVDAVEIHNSDDYARFTVTRSGVDFDQQDERGSMAATPGVIVSHLRQ
jgi:hypothetical protein